MSSRAMFEAIGGPDALTASKLYDLKGQVAIVTGGGTGLGLVTAAALAANGAKVYISGRRLEPLQAAAKDVNVGQIVAVQADVSSKEGIKKLREEVMKNEKFINILVNNAGVSLPKPDIDACEQTAEGLSKQMFDNEDFDVWEETHRINVTANHFLAFAFLPLLAAAKTVGGFPEPGNIVNVASLSGWCRTSQRGQFNYNSSKAATIHLSKMLSTEFSRRNLNIRVNAICPGYFPSGMSVKEIGTKSAEEEAKFYRSHEGYGIPFGKVGTARDYAQLILMVVSNSYMTGSEILIDGGWMAEEARRFHGRFGGNSSEAYQRQLSAPVHKWKKAWVSPTGLQPESSYKICKWVRVDATAEHGSPAPDEDEEMEDGDEGEEGEGEDGAIAEDGEDAGEDADVVEPAVGAESQETGKAPTLAAPTTDATKPLASDMVVDAAEPTTLGKSPSTSTPLPAPALDPASTSIPAAVSPAHEAEASTPAEAAPSPAPEPSVPASHTLPANAIEIHNTAPHSTEMGAGDLAGVGGVEMTQGEVNSAPAAEAAEIGMEVDEDHAGAGSTEVADVEKGEAPEVDDGLVMGDNEPVREEFIVDGEDKPREVDV